MGKSNVEFISYQRISHIRFLLNRINFRKEHVHGEFEAFLVLEGKGKALIKGEEYSMEEGDIFFIDSSMPHAYSAFPSEKTPPLLLIFQCSNRFLKSYLPSLPSTSFHSGKMNGSIGKKEITQFGTLLLQGASLYFDKTKGNGFDIIANAAQIMSFCFKHWPFSIVTESARIALQNKRARVERIIAFIEANYQSDIHLEDLAAEEGISITHLSHQCKELFDKTFQECVSLRRLQHSVTLLSDPAKTLMDVCYESGFSDLRYMKKAFLKQYGCTPKEYRNRLLETKIGEVIVSEEGEEILSPEQAKEYLKNVCLDLA